MKAIVMAGGEGTRLRPLTCTRPKPMVPVANRPVMAYALEILKKCGVKEIGVTLQYLPWMIEDYFGDGAEWGIRLRYFIEREPLGTAGSVKNAASFLDEPFLVVSGDALTDFDLSQAIAFHQEKKALATIVLTSVSDPLEYGVTIIDRTSGRVERFLEKPSWGEVFSDLVNTGIYVLQPEVLDYIPQGKSWDFSKNLFPLLLEKGLPLYAVVLNGFWCDIGNLDQYRQAHLDMLEGKVNFPLPGKEWREGIYIGEGVEISPLARMVPPVLIGDNCRIGRGAEVGPATVIGPNCTVEDRASLRQCVVDASAWLGPGCEVRGALVGRGAKLHEGVRVFAGATIGDGSTLESWCEIRPGVKIWPEKKVASRSVVNTSIVWGEGPSRALFRGRGISGWINDELSPEQVTKIAAAYGAILARGRPVVLSSALGPGPRLAKKAAAVGLQAAGLAVWDLGTVGLPVARHAVRHLQLPGGMHVGYHSREPEMLTLYFFDDQGLDLGSPERRRVENIFWREEDRRIPLAEVREIQLLPGWPAVYLKELLAGAARVEGWSIMLASPAPEVESLARQALQSLGVEVTPWSVHTPAWPGGVHMAAFLDANGEGLWLATPAGNVVDAETIFSLVMLGAWERDGRGPAIVPVSASSAIDELAGRYGVPVIRTREDLRSLALTAAGQGQEWQGRLRLDGLYCLIRLLAILPDPETSLEKMLTRLPSLSRVTKTAYCPWEDKGRVMRQLIEATAEEKRELIDGVKIYRPEGWTLLIPDPEEASYHILAESYSQEMADELTSFIEGLTLPRPLNFEKRGSRS